MARMKPLTGTLWIERREDAPTLDIYNPNMSDAWAVMKSIDGVPYLSYAINAPRVFRTEVQEHLDKLKTILILGGPT